MHVSAPLLCVDDSCEYVFQKSPQEEVWDCEVRRTCWPWNVLQNSTRHTLLHVRSCYLYLVRVKLDTLKDSPQTPLGYA
jgi:hypothetical protein